jgi:hypothetical protein
MSTCGPSNNHPEKCGIHGKWNDDNYGGNFRNMYPPCPLNDGVATYSCYLPFNSKTTTNKQFSPKGFSALYGQTVLEEDAITLANCAYNDRPCQWQTPKAIIPSCPASGKYQFDCIYNNNSPSIGIFVPNNKTIPNWQSIGNLPNCSSNLSSNYTNPCILTTDNKTSNYSLL